VGAGRWRLEWQEGESEVNLSASACSGGLSVTQSILALSAGNIEKGLRTMHKCLHLALQADSGVKRKDKRDDGRGIMGTANRVDRNYTSSA